MSSIADERQKLLQVPSVRPDALRGGEELPRATVMSQTGPLCCLRAKLLRQIAELSQSPPSFAFSVLGRQGVG